MILQALEQGIKLTHKNWKVIPYQISILYALVVFSFILLVLPLILSFNMLNIDLEQLINFFNTRTYPINVVDKYLKLAGIIAINSFFYSAYCMVALFIVIGGTVGSLKKSLEIKDYKVSFISFLKEGGTSLIRLWSMMSTALTSMLLVFLFGFPLLHVGFDKILLFLENESSQQYVQFFDTFTSLFMMIVPLWVFFFIVTICVYSTVGTVLTGKGIFKSLGNSLALFEKRPFVMSFFSLLVLLFMGLNITALMIMVSESLFTAESHRLLFSPYSLFYYLVLCYSFTFMTGSVLSSYLHLSSSFHDSNEMMNTS